MAFRNIFIAIGIFLVVLLVAIFFFLMFSHQTAYGKVCFKNNCFDVALATTPVEQQQGLMFQTTLAANKGMLFIFNQEGMYPFWMKNTLIPLDIIWIDNNDNVVFISHDTPPCKEVDCPSVQSTQAAKYVLEINGGLAQRIGLQAGDKVSIGI